MSLYFGKGEFENLHVRQKVEGKQRIISTETGFEMMKITPVVLRTDIDPQRASHMLYEIPILTTDLGTLCVITESIQKVLFEIQRRGNNLPSQLLRLEAFGVCESEKGICLKIITPRATPLSNYIGETQICLDEIMFFASDLGRVVRGITELRMTGILMFEDVYVRKDASSHVPTLCVSPVVFLLPMLLQQYLASGSQIIAPEVYISTFDSRVLTWSVGILLYKLTMGVMPFNNYSMNQTIDLSNLPNDLLKDAIGKLLSLCSRPFPESINEIELFRISNGWKMFRSGDANRYVKCIDISRGSDGCCVYGGQNEEGNNVAIWEEPGNTAVEVVKEARVIRLCESNHIANVIDVCVGNGRVYLVTEGCNIGTLENYVEHCKQRDGGMTKREVQYFSNEIINAVRYLRMEKGVVISELKLGDFLLSTNPNGGMPIVKLARCRGCCSVRECEGNGKGRTDLQALGMLLKIICECCREEERMNKANEQMYYTQPIEEDAVLIEANNKELKRIIEELLNETKGVDWNKFLKIPYIGGITEEDQRIEYESKIQQRSLMYGGFTQNGGCMNYFSNCQNCIEINPQSAGMIGNIVYSHC